jgi:putative transposase
LSRRPEQLIPACHVKDAVESDRDIVDHGTQQGRVALKDRELTVEKLRLRRKNPKAGEPAEVEIPAYEAMRQDGGLAERMREIVMAGVSTRRYNQVIPEMTATVGVSKSQVSRETIEAGERLLADLARRDFSALDLLAVWIDGVPLGSYHAICAVGVDDHGKKHLLGLREGATENPEVAKSLLVDLASRGLDSKRRRLFVIDGSLALRKGIDLVFGVGTPVQRCRNHKLRNILGHLPEAQHDQARSTLRAAFKLDAKEGMAQLEKYAT